MEKPKVIVIVGPTASGKTSLSIDIAKRFNGEVVSADSRQVYRGLDLGSGKVKKEEMGDVPHHLLDIADPMVVYNANDFRRDASAAIEAIVARGHLPIIAGGSFMYVDTLLGRISLPPVDPDPVLRAELETLSAAELAERLTALDPRRAASIDLENPRRVTRAIEVATALGSVPPSAAEEPYETITFGIDLPQSVLHANIQQRLHDRLVAGMVAEVEGLLAAGVTHERLEDLGLEYRYLSRYLRGELSDEAMVEELETKIRQFAKRQLTWLRRNQSIIWIDPQDRETIYQHITTWLAATS